MFHLANNSKCYILVKVETVSRNIPHVNMSRISQTDIPKGELLILKGGSQGDWLHVKGNEDVAFKFDGNKVAPLDDTQLGLLEAITTPKGCMMVFATPGWLDWGAAVKTGDRVYIRVLMKDDSECCSTARVHYIGRLTDRPGTFFGVEISVS